MAKMDEFLLEYFRRRIIHDMPVEQHARLSDYLKKNDLIGKMKSWPDLFEKDADGNYVIEDGLVKKKPMPDGEVGEFAMDPGNWIKLFKAFQDTFQSMDAHKKSFKYEKLPTDFLNKYFGEDKLFSYVQATDDEDREIAKFLTALNTHTTELRPALRQGGIITDDFTWDDFTDGLKSSEKKYNKDPKFRDKLKGAVESLVYQSSTNADVKAAIQGINMDTISEGFKAQDPTPAKMNEFKNVYTDLLDTLYRNEGTIYKKFKQYDDSKISKMLDEAKDRVNYNDKDAKEYISPKRKDELSFTQYLSDKWDKTYTNYFEKYFKLQGDRLFYSQYAQDVCKAIDKEKIQSTAGLAGILEKSDAIKKRLTSKNALDHFTWFTDTLNDLKSDPQISKAFAGALTHGNQTKRIVEEIIMRAINSNPQKIEQAKSTLEILSVMQYGLTTSKTMDALRKTDFVIFADGSTSYAKGPMGDMAKVADKIIQGAIIGVGYGITMAGNAIRLSGSKFNNKGSKDFNAQHDKTLTDTAAKRTSLEVSIRDTRANIATAQGNIRDVNREWRRMGAGVVNDDTQYQAKKDALNNAVAGTDRKQQRLSSLQDFKRNGLAERLDTLQQKVDALDATKTQSEDALQQYEDVLQQYQDELQALNNKPIWTAADHARLANLQNQATQARNKLTQIQADIAALRAKPTLTPTERMTLSVLENSELTVHGNLSDIQAEIADFNASKTLTPADIAQQNRLQATLIPQAIARRDQAIIDRDKATDKYNKGAQHLTRFQDYTRRGGGLETHMNQLQTDIGRETTANTAEAERLRKWHEATESVNNLTELNNKHIEQFNNWDENHKDKYQELMAYWDFLQTGRTTHTGKMYSWSLGSKEKKQDFLNAQIDSGERDASGNPIMKSRKEVEFLGYLNNYGRAA